MSFHTRETVILPVLAALLGCSGTAECRDCFDQGYRIDLSAAAVGTSPPPAVLFSGWRNGWCQDDLVCTGSPDVHLGELNPGAKPHRCESEELVAFAGGYAPTVSEVDRTVLELPVTFDRPIAVPVTLWIAGDLIEQGAAIDEAEQARRVFADFGTGVDLVIKVKTFPDHRLEELADHATCALAPKLIALADDPADDGDTPGFDANHLNVYYVAKFVDTEAAPAGLNCYRRAPDISHQDVMFVLGLENHSPMILAHELGHALGLLRSAPIPGGDETIPGEVDELALDPYLAEDNLMRSATSTEVKQVTLGQIYRMHFDNLSWLKNARTIAGYPRECQNSAVEGGPCPPLTFHPPRGWP